MLARLREGLKQLLERQVLMALGIQRGLAGLAHQLGEGQAPVQLGTQHQGIDKEAHHGVGFLPWPVGAGHADTNIALARVAIEHGLKRCQQPHKGRGVVGLRGLTHCVTERSLHVHAVACGAALFIRGAWMIGGEAEHGMLVTQLQHPITALALCFALRQPLALPSAVVGVLQRQWRQHQGLIKARRRIQPRKLVNQQVQ